MLLMRMVMMVVVIVRMGVRHPVVRVFVGVRFTGGRRHRVGVVMVSIVVGVLVRVAESVVRVGVRMLGHGNLLR
jgi:hypothetical protein